MLEHSVVNPVALAGDKSVRNSNASRRRTRVNGRGSLSPAARSVPHPYRPTSLPSLVAERGLQVVTRVTDGSLYPTARARASWPPGKLRLGPRSMARGEHVRMRGSKTATDDNSGRLGCGRRAAGRPGHNVPACISCRQSGRRTGLPRVSSRVAFADCFIRARQPAQSCLLRGTMVRSITGTVLCRFRGGLHEPVAWASAQATQ